MTKRICFLFLMIAFTSFSNAQMQSQIQKVDTTKLDSISQGTTEAVDSYQNVAFPYAQPTIDDPLFFIDGQLCQHLRKIYQDKRGNLWLGTNVYEIIRYDGTYLKYFTEYDGVNNGRITAIVEDSTGVVWFGTSQGLTKFEDESFTTFTEEDGLLDNEIWDVIIDSEGIFWIATNSGLSRFDGVEFTTIAIPKAEVSEVNTIYAADRIVAIVEDKAGNLWLGTDGFGMCKYDGETFTQFTTKDGLCDNTICDLFIDSRDNLWVGTFWGGLSKYDGENFNNFTKDGVISGVEVGAFFEDKNGDIWFAVENNGVYKYVPSSGVFTNLYQEQGLITNGILSIYKDQEDRFWFGGWGGLFRYDGNSFSPVTEEGPWTK